MTRLIRRFVSFACCVLVALTLLGCAEPLSLASLHALNPRSYAGTICGIPKGKPPNTRFYAINVAMNKVVTDRNPEALRDFMPLADSVHEVSTWAPASSVKTVPISMGVTCPARQELPSDLQAALNAIVGTSCQLPEKNRPTTPFIGQTYSDVPRPQEGIELKLVAGVLTWALQEAAANEPRIPVPRSIQMLPMPGLEVLPGTTTVEAEAPSLLEHPVTQFSAGAVSGAAIGTVPFGSFGADIAIELHLLPKGTYWARVGKACGEIAVGTGQMIFGCAGMSAGAGMSGTGVGAVPGVLIVSGSYAIAANGCVTTGHGLADLHELWREGDPATNVPSEAPSIDPSRIVLKSKKLPKAAAQPAVAAASKPATPAPAAKPVTSPKAVPKAEGKPAKAAPKAADKPPQAKPTVPSETTTTTRFKASGKTVTKKASGTTTTTQGRGKPSAASAEATPVAKGAKRGPKTDPAEPHNATVRREGDKLKAEGYTIVAGGGVARERLIETTGGIKSGRRPDVIGEKADVPDRRINVGRTKADGTPVKREQEALDDLNQHSDPPTEFVPYDRETP